VRPPRSLRASGRRGSDPHEVGSPAASGPITGHLFDRPGTNGLELPPRALQLDLAILDDAGRVVVLAEAKRDVFMLDPLTARVTDRYTGAAPDMTTTKDEARQLGWRLWRWHRTTGG
jgi:hypothetical protein